MAVKIEKQKPDATDVQIEWAKERCLLCGKETIYDFTTPVTQREFYIPGAGQLCRKCYVELDSDR